MKRATTATKAPAAPIVRPAEQHAVLRAMAALEDEVRPQTRGHTPQLIAARAGLPLPLVRRALRALDTARLVTTYFCAGSPRAHHLLTTHGHAALAEQERKTT